MERRCVPYPSWSRCGHSCGLAGTRLLRTAQTVMSRAASPLCRLEHGHEVGNEGLYCSRHHDQSSRGSRSRGRGEPSDSSPPVESVMGLTGPPHTASRTRLLDRRRRRARREPHREALQVSKPPIRRPYEGARGVLLRRWRLLILLYLVGCVLNEVPPGHKG